MALETKVSPHQMGLKDLLSVALLLGHLPREMVLVGVQPGSIEMGTELTPDVAAKLDVMLATVLDELRVWGIHPEPS
jgi:hydrogenase maturation protease